MIVCEEYKFVFVHIFKTAGTSIKRSLRRFAMPAWQECANVILKRIGVSQFGPRRYPDHMRASQLIDQIGMERFQEYFSFAFVRNPWDLELSHYKYILSRSCHPCHNEIMRLGCFSEYVRWRCDERFQLQSDFISNDQQVVVNFVGRFESLQNDFRYVCEQIGVRSKLGQLNRTRLARYQDHYDDRTRELIAQTFAQDIEQFEYRFDRPASAASSVSSQAEQAA